MIDESRRGSGIVQLSGGTQPADDDLFAFGRFRNSDPVSSVDAAHSVDVGRCEALVLGELQAWAPQGRTPHELVDEQSVRTQGMREALVSMRRAGNNDGIGTFRPRLVPLEEKGHVHRLLIGWSATGRARYETKDGRGLWFFGPLPADHVSPPKPPSPPTADATQALLRRCYDQLVDSGASEALLDDIRSALANT